MSIVHWIEIEHQEKGRCRIPRSLTFSAFSEQVPAVRREFVRTASSRLRVSLVSVRTRESRTPVRGQTAKRPTRLQTEKRCCCMSSMPLGKATMPQKAPDIDEPQIARFLGPGRTPILRRSFQKRSQKDQNEAMGSKRPDARTDMDGLDDISKSLLQQSRSSDPTGSYGSLLQACSIAKNDTKEGVSSSDCSGTTPAAATTSGPWLDSEQSGTNDLNSPASGLMSLLHDTVRNKPISPTISTTPNNLGTTSFEDDGTSLSELSHASEAETERLNDEESLETPVGLYDASESLTSLNETPVTYQSPASAASSTGKRKRSIPEVDAYEPLSEEKPVPDTAFRLQDELDGETEAKLEDFALKALDQPPASILMGEKEGMEAEEEEDETMAQSEQVESGAEEDEAQDQEGTNSLSLP